MQKNYGFKKNFKRRFPPAKKEVNIELVRAIRAVQIIGKTSKNITPETEYVVHNGFSDFPLSEQLIKNIINKNYTSPTPIQDQSIGHILSGRDIIGIANTGTGKTAAFLIPLIDKVFNNKFEKVLIVTPTRELALQIDEEFRGFSKAMGIKSVLCIGGVSDFKQKNELRQNFNFVIGTPGRIKDLIEQKGLFLGQFGNVVLDEADRMVDIGFINDIKYFISLLPKKRQSLFFSATISGKVSEILKTFVHNPVTVSVKKADTLENIKQEVVKIDPGSKKIDQLHNLLAQDGYDKVLVFGRTKWGIQKLTNELVRRGFKASAIHGNKSQNQRQRALDDFKNSRVQVLLATDVVSRGLDIPDVSHVINYDMPQTVEDYIHRIGRTGRANKTGTAVTFVDSSYTP